MVLDGVDSNFVANQLYYYSKGGSGGGGETHVYFYHVVSQTEQKEVT